VLLCEPPELAPEHGPLARSSVAASDVDTPVVDCTASSVGHQSRTESESNTRVSQLPMLLATFSTKAFFEAFYRVCLILTIFYLYIRKQATQLVKTESAFPPEKILWVFVTYQIKYFR